jgi:cytochrome P450
MRELIPLSRDRTLAPFEDAAAEEIAEIRFFGRPAVLVNRVDWIHDVLVRQAVAFRKGPLLSVIAKPLLGNGLLTGPNDLNRRQRRVISPAFAHRRVADYAVTVTDYAERVTGGWRDGQTVDVADEMVALTLGIIGQMLLSEDLLDAASTAGPAITTLMRFAIDAQQSPWAALRSVPRTLAALRLLNRLLYRGMATRRRAGPEGADEADLLARILFARDDETGGPYMSDRLVRDETMTLFLAGLEAVAMALTWSLHALDLHPDIAERARAQVDAALGGRTVPTMDDLANMPFVLQVFKETLRLYSPAYVVARQALEPVTIGPRRLRRGEVVFVSPYLLHRRAENFAEPLRFDPDRWADPDAERKLPSRYAYLPFGAGPRVCIGGHFAMLEGHLVLASIIRRFNLKHAAADIAVGGGRRFDAVGHGASVTSADGTTASPRTVEPEPLFTLRPRGGLPMVVRRRDLAPSAAVSAASRLLAV